MSQKPKRGSGIKTFVTPPRPRLSLRTLIRYPNPGTGKRLQRFGTDRSRSPAGARQIAAALANFVLEAADISGTGAALADMLKGTEAASTLTAPPSLIPNMNLFISAYLHSLLPDTSIITLTKMANIIETTHEENAYQIAAPKPDC